MPGEGVPAQFLYGQGHKPGRLSSVGVSAALSPRVFDFCPSCCMHSPSVLALPFALCPVRLALGGAFVSLRKRASSHSESRNVGGA